MQQGGILSEVDHSVKLWKLFNNWTVTFDFAERIIIGKNNLHGLGSIVQLLTSIVLDVMTVVDLLQQGIFCCRGGIFSIMVIIGKKDVLGLGSIVQLLTGIVFNSMTAVDLLQHSIFCSRGGIFSIMVTIQEFMIKSAENVLVTNSYIITFVSGFAGSVSILFFFDVTSLPSSAAY